MARGKAQGGRYSPSRQRGGGGGDDDGSQRWLQTYADAVTLLMAFFVMLYAMSEVNTEKWEAFVQGLRVQFANESDESVLPPGGSVVGESASSVGEVSPPAPPLPIETILPPAAQQPLDDTDQLEQVQAELDAALTEQGMESVADYRYDQRGLVVSIASDDVLFATGSTDVGALGRDVVATVADVLRRHPNDVVVEGHTDNVPLDRAGYTNWNLSTDRAVAVLELLIDEHDLRPMRLGATGYGPHRPVAPNDTSDHRARNRRVDVLVVSQGETNG